ncbi:PREDICTED: uridine-cytidine kinase-like 1 isoform X2 [Branchiostoma belcheri]|uniref:Uridine-cytidine kinase n=1 Tax=Branchiostoma belcheri TaxID=7741 RepID=A0A6P5A6P4_BRABE|nr:PREDICTED: uridine-cytidine kinase-like 1 isoform X2 [Branchiostoma belcheri]
MADTAKDGSFSLSNSERTSRSSSQGSGSASGDDPFGDQMSQGDRQGMRRASRTRTQSTSDIKMLRTSKRTIYTAGRPPWFDVKGQFKEAFVIGICGGSASGKTTVANKIIEALDVPWVVQLSMDSFYKVLTPEEKELAHRSEYNFDHPDAFDFELLFDTLKKLKRGRNVEVPIYDFTTHSRTKQQHTLYGANVIIFEGILTFVNPEVRKMLDMKVFVDTDSDIRLARRLRRDITERNRDLVGVLKQYDKFVKPAFEQHIEPSMAHADIVVPRGGENEVAIDLIIRHVHSELEKRDVHFRSQLAAAGQGQPLPSSLHVLESTPQVRGMHTIIRNRETNRDEFIFYSKRLMRLLIEQAMAMLPFKTVRVKTPQGSAYEGMRFNWKRLCGVSILRAGETMEPALCAVCKDIRLGKILIQTNLNTGEPELHYLRLPKNISEDHVFLMDATVSTGAAAIMAIRVLLDHDVQEENIFFLSMLMAESGVQSVAYAFPKVKIMATAVDPEVNDKYHIIPGIGNFGDRYFGTD